MTGKAMSADALSERPKVRVGELDEMILRLEDAEGPFSRTDAYEIATEVFSLQDDLWSLLFFALQEGVSALGYAVELAEEVLPRRTEISLRGMTQGKYYHADVELDDPPDDLEDDEYCGDNAPNHAIALCIAALKALRALQSQSEDAPNEQRADGAAEDSQ